MGRRSLILLCVILVGCSFGSGAFVDHDVVLSVVADVGRDIRYVRDDPADYWQTPNETLTLGTGDCEDRAILALDELYSLGYEGEMRVGKGYNKDSWHAWIAVDGVEYDPGLLGRVPPGDYETWFVWSYDALRFVVGW